VAATGQA